MDDEGSAKNGSNPYVLITLLNNYIRRDEHERELKAMQNDIHDLKESTQVSLSDIRADLRAMQEALIKSQQEGQAKTIKVLIFLLTAFCTPIVVAIIIFIIQTFLH